MANIQGVLTSDADIISVSLHEDENGLQTGLNPMAASENEFHWTRATTWLLIKSFEGRKDQFRNPKIKNKEIWKAILNDFLKKGYCVTIDVLDRKWRNLKKTYKNIKDKNNKSGEGRTTWDYFDALQEIYFNDQTVNPQHILASMTIDTSLENSVIEQSAFEKNVEISHTPHTAQVIQLSRNSSTDITQPSSSTKSTIAKQRGNKQLLELRKKQLQIEEERVTEIRHLREAIEENNTTLKEQIKVQKERNEILRQLLNKTE